MHEPFSNGRTTLQYHRYYRLKTFPSRGARDEREYHMPIFVPALPGADVLGVVIGTDCCASGCEPVTVNGSIASQAICYSFVCTSSVYTPS
jgi:hypothetical protein